MEVSILSGKVVDPYSHEVGSEDERDLGGRESRESLLEDLESPELSLRGSLDVEERLCKQAKRNAKSAPTLVARGRKTREGGSPSTTTL